ncbi:uncharacterized protein Z518_01748 [Rhinocladiella mackenziei CBS 650.93]|uniref:Alpha/beta hydrolase fold-3 domain-containing protein n=1 Tax=Rhinocladiella mackenziei CBS 650.93 TaxID=1442369 RepID=A0A0D2IXB9_9EURO|nr:uncharacterized protein Z518_01748 [Rhinocladiella mackenziei CBS 650.93]KIX10664.1 hypothetical protein Z518_01748 [Rhinocladiella mackenziei CBS 650.93]
MPATLSDKVLLAPALSLVLTKTVLSLLTSPLRGRDGAPTIQEHVMTSAYRSMFVHFTAGQLQLILAPFLDSYRKWCKQQKLQPEIVDIPNTNTKGFWIGSKDSAKYVMLYCHGGGFVMPGIPPHLDLLFRCVQWSNGKLAIFCNAYTLAPEGVYPLQIGECVEALRYVLSLPGRTPATTLLGGDSAGGNLVLAILSHVSGHAHPSSTLVKPLQLSENLHGALAIAPWVSSDETKFKSMKEFSNRDIVNSKCSNYWIDVYKGRKKDVKDDYYIVPELAPASWWSESKVTSFLATAGEQEALRDAIISWADKFKEGRGDDVLKLVKGTREVHDAPLTPKSDGELDKLGDACQEAAIRNWIRLRLE